MVGTAAATTAAVVIAPEGEVVNNELKIKSTELSILIRIQL